MSAPLADTSVPVAEGDVLAGKYKVERVLGQGAMGVVVAAKHLHLQQRVAMKFLTGRATKEVLGRFKREARAASKLRNEHIARVIDFGTLDSGLPYLVMEYLSGRDLQQLLKAEGSLAIHEAVGYVLQVCEAMAEAHSAGIVHRDLKPANLFLTAGSDGSKMVKVLDFGIAKMDDSEEGDGEADMSLTRTEAVLGSPLYMSIEQVRSSRDVDQRADIYSIGAILYQLLTGRPPYEAQTFPELILKLGTEEPPPPTTFRADLPAALEQAILRCLDRDRNLRFGNVGDLAGALAPFALDEHIGSAERALRTIDKAGGPGSTTLSPAALRATRNTLAGTRTASSMSTTTTENPRAGRMKTLGLAAIALVLGMASVLALVVFISRPNSTAAGTAEPSGSPTGDTSATPAPTDNPGITPLVVPALNQLPAATATATAQPTAQPATSAAPPPRTEPKPTATAKAPPATTPAATPAPTPTPPPATTPTTPPKKNPLDLDIK